MAITIDPLRKKRFEQVDEKFFAQPLTPEQRRLQAPDVRAARREAIKPVDRTSDFGGDARENGSGISNIEPPVIKVDSNQLTPEQEAEKKRLEQEQKTSQNEFETENERLERQKREISVMETEAFAPRFEQQARQEAELEKTAGFEAAKRGTIRGSREQERFQIRRDLEEQRKGALDKERELRIQTQIRAAEGATAEELNRLKSRLNIAREDVAQFNRQLLSGVQQAGEKAGERQFELEKIKLQEDLRRAETPKEIREAHIKQIEQGGLGFLESLTPQQRSQMEKDAGWTPGFFEGAIQQLRINGDPKNEFTFEAPKIDDFGQVVTPGYRFSKKGGKIEVIDPYTGQPKTVLLGTEKDMKKLKSFNQYISTIGSGDIVNGSPFHKALEIDIDGKIGDSVTAFSGGEVVSISDTGSEGLGRSIAVRDSLGNLYKYGHLNSFLVSKGDKISPGEVIGTMGNTGETIPLEGDGSHLHIEAVDRNNKPISLFQAGDTIEDFSANNDALLHTEAALKGWTDKVDRSTYIQAKKQGITLPRKSEFEEQQPITKQDKRKINQQVASSDAFKAIKKAQDSFNFLKQFDDYWRNVAEKDLETFGEISGILAGKHKAALLNLKEFFNLGVLNGPDLEILEEILPDPSSIPFRIRRPFAGPAIVDDGIKTLNEMFKKTLQDRLRDLQSQYSEYDPSEIKTLGEAQQTYDDILNLMETTPAKKSEFKTIEDVEKSGKFTAEELQQLENLK